jgi:Flp pilus assembly protein TadG
MKLLRSSKARSKSENGSAMVEMALVLPILLLVLFGITEFGLVFVRYQVILSSAQEGARTASLFRPHCNSDDVYIDVVTSVVSSANKLGMELLEEDLTVDGACVAGGNVTVQVTYKHRLDFLAGFLGLLGDDRDLPLTAVVTMLNET